MRPQIVSPMLLAGLLAWTGIAVSFAEDPQDKLAKPATEFKILQPIDSPAAQGPAPETPAPETLPADSITEPAADTAAGQTGKPGSNADSASEAAEVSPPSTSGQDGESATSKVQPFNGRKVPNPGETRTQCDPIKRKIQRINQIPMVFRFVMLPRRGWLERQHRACLRPQSYREREYLESIPKP